MRIQCDLKKILKKKKTNKKKFEKIPFHQRMEKPMKICPTSVVIRKMQIKTTMRYHYIYENRKRKATPILVKI